MVIGVPSRLAAEEDEVRGWGVEKGDPTTELARRISSDIGKELLRGAISYLECKLGNSAGFPILGFSSGLDAFGVDFIIFS